MKDLLNFGVSDPLTLGMAHPVADRLETLGRARPATWRSRCLALSAMGVIALATAPLSIAADHPEHETETQSKTRLKVYSSSTGQTGQGYEIVTENGVKKAYQLFKDGKRKEVDLTQKPNGAYQLTYADGQVVELPNIDLEALEGLNGLGDLGKLEGLKSLRALDSLEGLAGLERLAGLEALKELNGLSVLADGEFETISFLSNGDVLDNASRNELRGLVQKFIKTEVLDAEGLSEVFDGNRINIIRNGDVSKWGMVDGDVVTLNDTVVNSSFEVFQSSDPLETAQRQLERTKRQIELLSNNETVSYDLKSALRDIESAQKSLEEAEGRLLDDND